MSQHSVGALAGRVSLHELSPIARVLAGRLDRLPSDVLDELRRHLVGGGSLLIAPEPDDAVAADLAGVLVERAHPAAQWFATLTAHPEAVRLDGEVPVSSTLRTLTPLADDVRVAATTGIAMRQRPVITIRSVGRGGRPGIAAAARPHPLERGLTARSSAGARRTDAVQVA